MKRPIEHGTGLTLSLVATLAVAACNQAQERQYEAGAKDKGGKDVELPVFGSVSEAMSKTGADVSIAFVPPQFAKDAIIEAIDAEIPLLVVVASR